MQTINMFFFILPVPGLKQTVLVFFKNMKIDPAISMITFYPQERN